MHQTGGDPGDHTLFYHHAIAHFAPSSRLMDATAAMQGVYSKQNTSRQTAPKGVSIAYKALLSGISTDRVETTLSFASIPVMRAVDIRQSPKPRGRKMGAIQPATRASMLFWESATMRNFGSKVCKTQITMVATKITVNARVRKSFAFSQSNCATFFAPGIR